MVKHAGQTLLDSLETYINRYVALPTDIPGQSLVLALWCVHTWLYERFSSTPYLVITANTKQAGKTLAMEVLALVCRNGRMLATLRPLALVRIMEAYEGRVTLFLDEAEKLSSGAVGDLRSVFTTGYRVGGKHAISAGKEFIEFRTFAPKCFALIGDVMDVVRDRSIVVHFRRSTPSVDFLANRVQAESEAARIVSQIIGYFQEPPALVQPTFLQGREREIWTVLFSVADAMRLDRATMERLERAAADLVGLKSTEARKFSKVQDAESDALDTSYSELAIRDLRSVLRDGETAIFSTLAVERLRAIPTSPWRTFRGVGLNVHTLSNLLKTVGVHSCQVRMASGKGAREAKQLNGYTAKSIQASSIAAKEQS